MIRRGEVYWLSVRGSRGSEQAGRRPALIIQNDRGNESSESTVVALMTSRVSDRAYPMHVVVGSEETGLDGRSTVLTEQVHTVDQSRLGSRTGMLLPPTMHEVDRAIHFSLGLMGCPIRRG